MTSGSAPTTFSVWPRIHTIVSETRWALPDLDSTVQWCKMRNDQKIKCTVDILGPYARTEEQVNKSVEGYKDFIQVIKGEELNASLSLKLSTLGITFDREMCRRNVLDICREAYGKGVAVDIDMEGWSFVKFTIDTAIMCAKEGYPLTLALQSYLERTSSDIMLVLDQGIRVRLVKGAYSGDLGDFDEIQDRFKSLAEVLFESGKPFTIGTHDPDLIEWIKGKAGANKKMVEFGFLKGFSDLTKVEMAKNGWKVLEYVPFGNMGSSYEARRLNYLKRLERLGRKPAP